MLITSTQNSLIKQIRKLHQAKERKQQGLCLLEGTNLIEAAVETGYPLTTLCTTLAWQQSHPALWQRAILVCDRVISVGEAALATMATTVNPDGAIAIAPRLALPSPQIPAQLTLVLDGIQDPGNLGTIVRTAAAVEADGLWVSGPSVDLDHPKVLRSTAGQWFRQPMAVSEDLVGLIDRYRRSGVKIVATTSHTDTSYWDVDFNQPTLILLGNEGAGLGGELLNLATNRVKIPMSPVVESLNVAIAAALILYEARRQQYLP
jgi:RNA methyltransferase, TrmH family